MIYYAIFYQGDGEDGLRFERCYQPGMVRCEACLELIPPEQASTHICHKWWETDWDEYFRELDSLMQAKIHQVNEVSIPEGNTQSMDDPR
jgi:hypothetical protein